MFNVLLERLPKYWHGYRIDTDFRTGIQIMQCLSDEEFSEDERIRHSLSMLFIEEKPDIEEALEGLAWYMSEFNHDNHTAKKQADQWRIYSAFKKQYAIDLNTAKMHWFVFMGLLSNLEECAFTRVVDIRLRKIDPKAGQKEKKALKEAKQIYQLEDADAHLTPEEKQAQQKQLEIFNNFMNAGKE